MLFHTREKDTTRVLHSYIVIILVYWLLSSQNGKLFTWQFDNEIYFTASHQGVYDEKGESSFLSITTLKAAAYLEYNQLQIT